MSDGVHPSYAPACDAGYSVVVGIDLGTSNTAAIYALPPDNTEPGLGKSLRAYKVQLDSTPLVKVPTVVAVDRETKVPVLFGQDCSQADPVRHAVFTSPKMKLYRDADLLCTELATASLAEEAGEAKAGAGAGAERLDHPLQLLVQDVLAAMLRYIRDRVISTVELQQGVAVQAERVRWVLTVPAIWSDYAKNVMRTAALEAGMTDYVCPWRLLLALEPECAALEAHCDAAGGGSALFAAGASFGVIDCGGGTIDSTSFQTLSTSPAVTLKQGTGPVGGAWGSTKVDAELKALLARILAGTPGVDAALASTGMLSMMANWDNVKRSYRPASGPWESAGSSTMGVVTSVLGSSSLPDRRLSLTELLEALDMSPKALKASVQRYNADSELSAATGPVGCQASVLVLPPRAMDALFAPCLLSVRKHITEELLRQDEFRAVSTLVLAGGFASSSLLQQSVRAAVGSGVTVVVPSGAEELVVRGAVRFGLHPGSIKARVVRATYGFEMTQAYLSEHHPPDRRVHDQITGEYRVQRVFDTLVQVGDRVELAQEVRRSYTPRSESQSVIRLRMFAASRAGVKWTDEPGVRLVAEIRVPVTRNYNAGFGGAGVAAAGALPPLSSRTFDVDVSFGSTEVLLRCRSFDGRVTALTVAFDSGSE